MWCLNHTPPYQGSRELANKWRVRGNLGDGTVLYLFSHLEGCRKFARAYGQTEPGKRPWQTKRGTVAVIPDLIISHEIANAHPSSARQKLYLEASLKHTFVYAQVRLQSLPAGRHKECLYRAEVTVVSVSETKPPDATVSAGRLASSSLWLARSNIPPRHCGVAAACSARGMQETL